MVETVVPELVEGSKPPWKEIGELEYIMEEWKEVRLGEFIEFHRGYDLTKASIINGPYPVVCSTSIMGYHNEYKIKGPGIVIGRSGTLGEVQYIETDFWPHNTSLYVSNFFGNDPKFVKYFLKIIGTGNVGGGSAVPTLNRNHLQSINVKVPPLPTQQKIAQILSSLDDKIELNNKINANLEQQAQALFKSWFVDFEPFGGEMPAGWNTCKAEEYFDITIGKTPPRKEQEWFSDVKSQNTVKWISISDMGNCGTYISDSSEYLTKEAITKHNVKVIPADTVILSFKLTVGRIAITDDELCTNEAIAHFGTDNKEINEYLYIYLKNFNYQTMGSTSSIAVAVNSKIIKSMPFIVPDHETITKFHNIVGAIFEQIRNNQRENKKLSNLRDTLLPKLMNGEIKY